MQNFAIAFTLMTLPVPVIANGPGVFVATNPERASGFKSLAACEDALGGPEYHGKARDDNQIGLRGTLFNRTAGNVSRCEMIDGEPLIVVYPKGSEIKAITR